MENKKLTRSERAAVKRMQRDDIRAQAREERRGARILDNLIRRAQLRDALIQS